MKNIRVKRKEIEYENQIKGELMKKYLKNRYQIICFLLSMTIFILVSLLTLIIVKNLRLALLIFVIPVGVIFLCSFFGFYFVFQFISFDEKGIHIYLLKKELRTVKWDDIIEIQESYIYRGPVYCIKSINGEILNLDRRKKIKKEIDKYYFKS